MSSEEPKSPASEAPPIKNLHLARATSAEGSGLLTPGSTASTESGASTEGPSTPASESGGELVATSTVTTEYTRKPKGEDAAAAAAATAESGEEKPVLKQAQTTQVTHVGARELQHQVDKDGGVHLKPQQSSSAKKRGKKIRAVVTFKPRQSRFETAAKDPFRGFYTLFWMSMGIVMLNTFYTSFTDTGKIISLTFASLFSRDAAVLAISDGILVGSLFLCVPFAKALKRGWFRYWPAGTILQHSWQAAMLGCVIKWARYREWPWVQSGFFVLHTLSMMMKMHSYLAVNGTMSRGYHRLRRVEKQLEERLMEVQRSRDDSAGAGGSDEKSILEQSHSRAQAERKRQEALDEAWFKAVQVAHEFAGPEEGAGVLFDTQTKGVAAWALRENQCKMDGFRHRAFKGSLKRSAHRGGGSHRDIHHEEEKAAAEAAGTGQDGHKSEATGHHIEDSVRDPHPLATHPDVLLSSLAREVESLREDLMSVPPHKPDGVPDDDAKSSGGKESRVCWPDNVTFANFWDYLLVPTLVYELEYPRTRSIRPLYVLEKTLATFGTFFVIYVITEHFIIPHSPRPNTPLLQTFLKLALPMMLNYLLIFYIMFECVCNGFAELTRFADREFYQDWWNATSMDVFSRKWNKPVHSFLLKHVYASSIAGLGLGKTTAMLLTFLLSAFLHELVMAIVSGKIRGYLFAAQMSQLPLILLSKVPFIRDNESEYDNLQKLS